MAFAFIIESQSRPKNKPCSTNKQHDAASLRELLCKTSLPLFYVICRVAGSLNMHIICYRLFRNEQPLILVHVYIVNKTIEQIRRNLALVAYTDILLEKLFPTFYVNSGPSF
jgi:hypothetical protein